MPEQIEIMINGQRMQVAEHITVAAALSSQNIPCRYSVNGEPRAPLCGMGICFECRAMVDGILHSRTCQIACRQGMDISTQ